MSNTKNIKIGEWVNNGLNLFLNNFAELFPVFLIGELILIAAAYTRIGLFILHGPVACSLFYIALKKVRGKKVEMNDIGEGFKIFVPAFLAGLLIMIFSGIGFVLLILPGIFVAIMYMFTFLLIIDKKKDFWDAMEISRKTVFENIPGFVGFGLVLGLVKLAGLIACGIGVLVTAPIAICALAYAYVDIFDVKVEKVDPIIEEMSKKEDPLESLKDENEKKD